MLVEVKTHMVYEFGTVYFSRFRSEVDETGNDIGIPDRVTDLVSFTSYLSKPSITFPTSDSTSSRIRYTIGLLRIHGKNLYSSDSER